MTNQSAFCWYPDSHSGEGGGVRATLHIFPWRKRSSLAYLLSNTAEASYYAVLECIGAWHSLSFGRLWAEYSQQPKKLDIIPVWQSAVCGVCR
jgi:hypothetical protein